MSFLIDSYQNCADSRAHNMWDIEGDYSPLKWRSLICHPFELGFGVQHVNMPLKCLCKVNMGEHIGVLLSPKLKLPDLAPLCVRLAWCTSCGDAFNSQASVEVKHYLVYEGVVEPMTKSHEKKNEMDDHLHFLLTELI